MRLVGYIRVSRVNGRDGDSFISPDVQRERIAAYAKAHGHTITEWRVDLDESGGKIDRPAFGLALEACRRGDADGIMVAKLDRFARTLKGALECIDQLEAAGATLVSVADSIDASTPNGRMVLNMLLTLAQWERDRITAEWATARGRAIARGAYIGALAPIGYVRAASGRLVASDDAPKVRAAFEARRRGATIADVAAMLGMSWPGAKRLLANRTYTGAVRHGDFHQDDAHEPLVSLALFEACQVTKAPAKSRGRGTILAGLIRCASCRMAMGGAPTPSGGRRYRCTCGHCGKRASVDMQAADREVLAAYHRHAALSPSYAPGVVVGEVEAQLRAAEAELREFVTAARGLTADLLAAGVAARQADVDAARAELAELGTPQPAVLDDDASAEDVRRALTAAIRCVFVQPGRGPGRVSVVWQADDAPQLPRRGAQRNAMTPWAA